MNMYDILEKLKSVDSEAARTAVQQVTAFNKVEESSTPASKYQEFQEGWKSEVAGGVAGALGGAALGGPVGATIGSAVGAPVGRAIGDQLDEQELMEIGPLLAAGARMLLPALAKIGPKLAHGAATAGKAAADVAGKAATGVGRGAADVAKSVGQSAAQNAGKVGLGMGAYEIASEFAKKFPDGLNKVYDDAGEAASAITSAVGNALDGKTIGELAAGAVKYSIPIALVLGILYGGKKLIDKFTEPEPAPQAEGWKGTAAGAGIGAALGGPLGAAVGGVAGDKIGDEMEEGVLGTLGGAALGGLLGGPVGAAVGAVGGQEMTKGGSALIELNDEELDENFIMAAQAARDAGKEEFEYPEGSGKMHKTTISKKVADEIDESLAAVLKLAGQPVTESKKTVNEIDMNLLKGLQGAMSKAQKDPESERNIHKKYGYRTDRDDDGGEDDDYDEWGNFVGKKKPSAGAEGPKKRGRPAGSGKKLGAKSTGLSKLARKGAIAEDQDPDEYDEEGEMAKNQLRTIEDAAKELKDCLADNDNLPEWVQSKITKALDYIDTARDYMKSEKSGAQTDRAVVAVGDSELDERELTKPEMKKREEIVKSMKKTKGDFEKRYGDRGEEVMYATATKMAKKKAEEGKDDKEDKVEETTTAGSVAVAATGGKTKGIFGKGIYESFEQEFSQKLNESLSVNSSISRDDAGDHKTVTVTASDEDAENLTHLMKMAGLFASGEYKSVCSDCGHADCQCDHETVEEEYANAPEAQTKDTDFMVNQIAGGLNGPKRQINPNNMADNPMAMTKLDKKNPQVNVTETVRDRLFDLYKKFEG